MWLDQLPHPPTVYDEEIHSSIVELITLNVGKQPTQYLLVGFSYSGQSTLAKQLQEQLGFAHINIDQLKFNRGYTEIGDDDVPNQVWDEIFKEADSLIVKYLSGGKNIANEYAWVTREWRDRARNVAKLAGFPTKLIHFKVPLAVIKQRWMDNDRSKQRFQWSEDEFAEPTADENVIIYDQTTPLDKWIKQTLV